MIFWKIAANGRRMLLSINKWLSQPTNLGNLQDFLFLSSLTYELGITLTLLMYFHLRRTGVAISIEVLKSACRSSSSRCLKGGISVFFGSLLYLQMLWVCFNSQLATSFRKTAFAISKVSISFLCIFDSNPAQACHPSARLSLYRNFSFMTAILAWYVRRSSASFAVVSCLFLEKSSAFNLSTSLSSVSS